MRVYPVTISHTLRWEAVPGGTIQPVCDHYRFTVRPITRQEYQDWELLCHSDNEMEARILDEAVQSYPQTLRTTAGEVPWSWDRVPAGVVANLLETVLQLSGFGENAHPLIIERANQYLNSPGARQDLIILMAFDYNLDDLLAMDSESWHKLLGMAMKKLHALGIDPNSLFAPPRQSAGPSPEAVMAGLKHGDIGTVSETHVFTK